MTWRGPTLKILPVTPIQPEGFGQPYRQTNGWRWLAVAVSVMAAGCLALAVFTSTASWMVPAVIATVAVAGVLIVRRTERPRR